MKKKIKKMDTNSQEWKDAVYRLARDFLDIKVCRDCHGPVINGYCCTRCDSVNP